MDARIVGLFLFILLGTTFCYWESEEDYSPGSFEDYYWVHNHFPYYLRRSGFSVKEILDIIRGSKRYNININKAILKQYFPKTTFDDSENNVTDSSTSTFYGVRSSPAAEEDSSLEDKTIIRDGLTNVVSSNLYSTFNSMSSKFSPTLYPMSSDASSDLYTTSNPISSTASSDLYPSTTPSLMSPSVSSDSYPATPSLMSSSVSSDSYPASPSLMSSAASSDSYSTTPSLMSSAASSDSYPTPPSLMSSAASSDSYSTTPSLMSSAASSDSYPTPPSLMSSAASSDSYPTTSNPLSSTHSSHLYSKFNPMPSDASIDLHTTSIPIEIKPSSTIPNLESSSQGDDTHSTSLTSSKQPISDANTPSTIVTNSISGSTVSGNPHNTQSAIPQDHIIRISSIRTARMIVSVVFIAIALVAASGLAVYIFTVKRRGVEYDQLLLLS